MSGSENATRPKNVGASELIEDMFGLNVRGVHTIWQMFHCPEKVFTSARKADWDDRRYTPSIRLVFSLFAAMAALRFLWSGSESYFYNVTTDLAINTGEFATEAAARAFTDDVLETFAIVFPFALMLAHFVASLLLHVWGGKTPAAVRIRLYFSAIVPGCLFSLFMTALMGVTTEGSWFWVTGMMVLVVFALDFSTGMRGGVAGTTTAGRVARAGLVALVSLLVENTANILAFSASSAWVSAFS